MQTIWPQIQSYEGVPANHMTLTLLKVVAPTCVRMRFPVSSPTRQGSDPMGWAL